MNGVATFQIMSFKWRNGDALGVQFAHGKLQSSEVLGVGQDEQIGIPAKLGRAVKHASLTAHQQGTDLARCHRRKDFPYPARDQANLQCLGRTPRVRHSRANVPRVSSGTTPPIPRSQCPRVEACWNMVSGRNYALTACASRGTSRRTCPMMWSVVMPSASASKFRMRRWRRAAAATASISSKLTLNRP